MFSSIYKFILGGAITKRSSWIGTLLARVTLLMPNSFLAIGLAAKTNPLPVFSAVDITTRTERSGLSPRATDSTEA
ncbi:hypothetical protein FC66_GL001445 [Dellaglioa algida DSM 15638]|uniref:Uncharacterized protein n=1 Tax=Dellaglioa algida DSM 15638 TaxID=1423719 RepID=A0A0R1HGC0_9LACO|nr:hypothetical protein FC66_GL001445 [Dellaglioa algida DSM 15638]